MLKFDEGKKLELTEKALALRGQIEALVDSLAGCRNVWFMGIGGTYASSLQAEAHVQGRTELEIRAQEAADYNTLGNGRIGKGSVVVVSSVTGNTPEMTAAVEKAKAAGAEVIGFIDAADAPLARLVDHEFACPGSEQLKFLMTADRLLYRAGDFADYDEFYRELDTHLAKGLVEAEKQADAFGEAFASAHHDDALHYFVGAGTLWGTAYTTAMCYWEEMHWKRTKSIHAGEFFHGTLEVIERDTPVTLLMGEDAARPLAERVAAFLPRVCRNATIIDTKEYPLEGISERFRGYLSHILIRSVTQRIDAHMEEENRHPMSIRRYYRCMDY